MSRPFIKVGLLGIVVVFFGLFLMTIFPASANQLPEGFSVPIIAFEFLQSSEEILAFFGATQSPERDHLVAAMDLGNKLDYIYMVFYSGFLGTFCFVCYRLEKRPVFILGILLSFTILLGDAMENLQLLNITNHLEAASFGPDIKRLMFWTWLKWGGLACLFLLLVPHFFRGGWASKLISGIAAGTFALGVVSYFQRSQINELFSNAVALMFLTMILYSFLTQAQKQS